MAGLPVEQVHLTGGGGLLWTAGLGFRGGGGMRQMIYPRYLAYGPDATQLGDLFFIRPCIFFVGLLCFSSE